MYRHFFYFCTSFLFIVSSNLNAQIDWEKYPDNPVFKDITGGWTLAGAYGPSILIIDSTYHMWYVGFDGTYTRIGYATSLDGISWVPYANNPVLDVGLPGSYEATDVIEQCVIYDGSTFHMWYTGMKTTVSPWREAIGYATSPDGMNWTKYSDQPVLDKGPSGSWDDTKVFCPSVIYDGSLFHMWYSGGSTSSIRHTGYATSPDGFTWTKYANNPVMSAGSYGDWDYPRATQPEVLFDGTRYHMFYGGGYWQKQRIGYATSTDKITWTKNNNNPVLNKGESGSWDDYYVNITSVIIDTANSIFRMWYTGSRNPNSNLPSIGYATAPANINIPGNYETIQEAIDAAQDGNVVLVDEGTYYENINFKGKAITVASHYFMDGDTSHISKTIIDGSQPSDPDSGSVVSFISGENENSILCGFTITGGTGTKAWYAALSTHFIWGGGINLEGSSATICYNIVRDNEVSSQNLSTFAAGINALFEGNLYIHNNTITNNHVSSNGTDLGSGGGGMWLEGSGECIVENNIINENSVLVTSDKNAVGGGIDIYTRYTTGGIYFIRNNTISNNIVTTESDYKALGGGIECEIKLPTGNNKIYITENQIFGNELHCKTSMGGAIYVVYWSSSGTIVNDPNPTPYIANNLIYDNYSQDQGAGIGVWTVGLNTSSKIALQPQIINNTFYNNRSSDGCALFNFDCFPLLMNNILWDDLSEVNSREIFSSRINYPEYPKKVNDGKVYAYYSNIKGGWEGDGEGNKNEYPAFVDTSNNDFNLTDSSSCVGHGTDSVLIDNTWYHCPDTDFYGNARPNSIDDHIDMGAIESSFIINDIIMTQDIVLDDYSLKQNYPNPLNPSTTIEFTIPKSEFVELKISNILGKEVATLVSNKLNQGNHTYTFDGKNLASGIYYYQLVAGDYREVKKMILIK